MTLKGNPVSEGVAVGKAYVYNPEVYTAEESHIEEGLKAEAIKAFRDALKGADAELSRIIASFPSVEEEQSKIFAAHREMLSDEDMIDSVTNAIENDCLTPEYAVSSVFFDFISLLSKTQNELIGARTADLTDVRNRLIRILRGGKEQTLSSLPEDTVVIAHDLLPSDTAMMDRNHVCGIVAETGSATSHSAIIARSFRIPAVLGVAGACSRIATGDLLVVDAMTGEVIKPAGEEAVMEYRRKRSVWLQQRASTDAYLDKEPLTKDGVRIDIGVNIGSDKLGDAFLHADFCGLFRTEFLYMESNYLPTEEEQFIAYKRVLEEAKGKPVTLRTLDIGGDKTLPYMQLPKEDNPFLGKRAIRLCFDEIDVFKTQLRAALRASVFGKLLIMFPMVASIDDVRRAKVIMGEVKTRLGEEGVPFDEHVPLGVMIEIPAVAMIADLIAEEVDFASVGTNDLCQYLFAADRMNPEVVAYSQSYSPAMLRTLRMVASAFNKVGKSLSICGEMAGEPRATAFLIGLGIKKLSMSASNIASVKKALSSFSLEHAEKIVGKALSCATESEVLDMINKGNEVRGKFGTGKRCYSLDRFTSHLQTTCET